MSSKPDDHATQHDGAAAPLNAPAGEASHAPEYQELWLALAKRKWTSLVVVPADAEVPAADVAKKLADVGKELIEEPVTAISVTRLGYDSARALSDLQQYVDRARQGAERSPGGPSGDASIVEVGARPGDAGSNPNQALALAPSARLVISIPPVVNEPLGLAVAQFADAVVLTFHLGKTRLSEARRTIELIGRDRIVGCFIVR
ncbi:MAG: hypothetical protein U0229_16590 [Anaeromyxobacter sp.]